MRRLEQEIHKAVVSHLKARAESGVFFFHPANGGKRTIFEARLFKALGVIAGLPDLLFLKRGELFALELKAPEGRVSPAQAQVMKRLVECGATVQVASGLDEALFTLEYWGILKRDGNRAPGIVGDRWS